MNEEKKLILKMLQEGKISVDEAENLLNALGNEKGDNFINQFANKLSASIEKVISKAGEFVGNIDFDEIIDNSKKFAANFSLSFEDEKEFEQDVEDIEIDIPNADVKVEKTQKNKIILNEKIYIKDKFAGSNLLESKVEDGKLIIKLKDEETSKDDFNVKLKISLPKNSYNDFSFETVNGYFMLKDVDFNNINVNTVNGEVVVENTTSNIKAESVNGGMVAKNVNGNIESKTVNGSIKLFSVVGGYLKGECTNGRLKADSINLDQVIFNTQNGIVNIENIKDASEFDIQTGTGSIKIDTTGFDKVINASVDSNSCTISEKFKNRSENNGIYEVSNNSGEADLVIKAKSSQGSVSIK